MPLSRSLAPLLVVTTLVAACSRDAPAPPAAVVAAASAPASSARAASAASARAGYTATLSGRLQPGGPELRILLRAEAPPAHDDILRVRAIDIQVLRAGGVAEPLQRIERLDTRTPWTDDAPGAELLDMNFDGYADLRVIEFLPAGPNVPYRNWLYEPARARFAASPDLDELAAPSFDAERRLVQSQWREGAARYGTDTLFWRDGRLVPQRRVTREAKRPGVFTVRSYEWSGSGWTLTGTRESREP